MHVPDGLTGYVLEPGDPGYDQARLDYNLHFDQIFPRYIVFCRRAEDAETAVRFARTHGLPLRVRSGRHSYEAYSIVDGGIVIDVSRLHDVRLSRDRKSARIGAGANLGTIYQALWDQGHVAIPGGTCGGVGIAGLTLGGGFGLIGRAHGLACDSMTAVDMVDSEGTLLSANDGNHPDLMWASRGGGGGNFGIVTEFEFRVVPVAEVTIFRIVWPWVALPEAFAAFQAWADPKTLDERLSPVMNLRARSTGTTAAFGQFLGPLPELQTLIRPLVRAVTPIEIELQHLPFIDAVRHFGGAIPGSERWTVQATVEPGERFKDTSAYQYRIFPGSAVAILRDHLADTPSPACLVEVDSYGGKIAQLSDRATAFPHRQGVRALLQPQAYWNTDSEARAHIAWVESLRHALLPYTDGGYLNYIDRDVKDWPRFYYGPNLPRLLKVKAAYDPENIFDFPQGLGQLLGRHTRP